MLTASFLVQAGSQGDKASCTCAMPSVRTAEMAAVSVVVLLDGPKSHTCCEAHSQRGLPAVGHHVSGSDVPCRHLLHLLLPHAHLRVLFPVAQEHTVLSGLLASHRGDIHACTSLGCTLAGS